MLADGSIGAFPAARRRRRSTRRARGDDARGGVLPRRSGSSPRACRDEIDRRFPKVLRRVGGYNLDEFVDPAQPFNLAKMIVGSEGTLALVVAREAQLVPLPTAKAVLTIEFDELLDALAATPLDPAARALGGRSDGSVHPRPRAGRARRSTRCGAAFSQGDPGALLCVEFYGDRAEDLPPRLDALEARARGVAASAAAGAARSTPAEQARIWSLREAALGLSMAMKGDAKSLSFVEDTAVAPEKLRDYIERFLADHSRGTAPSPASTPTRRSAACTCARSST